MTYQLLTYAAPSAFNQAALQMTAAGWEIHSAWWPEQWRKEYGEFYVLWQRKATR